MFASLAAPSTRLRSSLLALAAAALISLPLASCGKDDGGSAQSDGGSASAAAETTSTEERQVSDQEVTVGLRSMKPLVAAAVATAGTGAATAAFDPIEAKWRTFEGTVRTKEQDLYLAIEDGFS